MFDADTAVVAGTKTKDRPKPGLVRTTDGGKTFTPAGDHAATALPRWHGDALYWLAGGGLITSADKGATWTTVGRPEGRAVRPGVRQGRRQLFVLTRRRRGREHRRRGDVGEAVPLPKELKGVSALTWLDYDPVHDVLYVMKMGSELYALRRDGR